MIPEAGAVLGVDVGFSPTRRSSGVCRLDWSRDEIGWQLARFRAVEPERTETLLRLVDRPLLAAAFDGPLAPGFGVVGHYREAERRLTRGFGTLIGKPGSSGSPVGRLLNAAASTCATIVRDTGRVAPARHAEAIDRAALVEAFPSSYLGLMIVVPKALVVRRGDRSDVFYEHLAGNGRLDEILAHLLPGRRASQRFEAVINHDDRAALVCALTALGLAAGKYAAVGDADGFVILPPRELMAGWAQAMLS